MVGSFEETAKFWRGLPPTDTDAPLDIPLRDGRVSKARVYTSPAHTGPRALIVYLYGGGWALGEPAHIALTAKPLAAATGAVVVAPTYRLSHQALFPVVWDALAWLSQPAHAATLGADLSAGFILGGVSAGGSLAAVTAQRYVRDGSAQLTGVALLVPYLLEAPLVPPGQRAQWLSRAQNDTRAGHRCSGNGLPAGRIQTRYRLAVQRAAGLPPVFMQVAGQDPLRDDGLVYAGERRADAAQRLHNLAFPTLKSAYRANIDLILGVGWLLGKAIGDDEAGRAFRTARALVSAL